jgi:hypothetical protein
MSAGLSAVYTGTTSISGAGMAVLVSKQITSSGNKILPNASMRTGDPGLGTTGKVITTIITQTPRTLVLFQGAPSNWLFTNLNGNMHQQIFMVDSSRRPNITLISRLGSDLSGVPADGFCRRASMNSHGTIVAFSSMAENIDPHANTTEDVFFMTPFVTDAGLPCRKVNAPTGAPNASSFAPSLSDNGFNNLMGAGVDIVFQSNASNYLPSGVDTNNSTDIYVARIHPNPVLNDHVFIRFSVSSAGGQALGHSINPDITGDGKHVVYQSSANNLILDDASEVDVFETLSPQGPFLRGNSNSDNSFNLTDSVVVLAFLFQGGDTPACLDAADADDNSVIDISDSVFIVNHLFSGGPPPPCPFECCGEDPTVDALTCAKPGTCPSFLCE